MQTLNHYTTAVLLVFISYVTLVTSHATSSQNSCPNYLPLMTVSEIASHHHSLMGCLVSVRGFLEKGELTLFQSGQPIKVRALQDQGQSIYFSSERYAHHQTTQAVVVTGRLSKLTSSSTESDSLWLDAQGIDQDISPKQMIVQDSGSIADWLFGANIPAVPTAAVDTPWSRFIDAMTIISAIAAVLVLGIELRGIWRSRRDRRINIFWLDPQQKIFYEVCEGRAWFTLRLLLSRQNKDTPVYVKGIRIKINSHSVEEISYRLEKSPSDAKPEDAVPPFLVGEGSVVRIKASVGVQAMFVKADRIEFSVEDHLLKCNWTSNYVGSSARI